MNTRECIEAFWAGERPERIPLTMYHFFGRSADEDERWKRLYEAGLAPTCGAAVYQAETPGLEVVRESRDVGGHELVRITWKTPVGEIYSEVEANWVQKYLLSTREDYRVMQWVAEHTELTPNYDAFAEVERNLSPYGIPQLAAGRTPLQTILVDYTGLANFAIHLFDYEDEVRALYDAMLPIFRRRVEIIAEGPGKFVQVLENFTAEQLGPDRFGEFLLPVYEELYPQLHEAGKIVGNHYDGKIASCADMIAGSPIDLLESLTSPPEGDLTLADARERFGDKLFWANINVSKYELPADDLRAHVLDLAEQGSVDGKYLAFEVSEDLPKNWEQSIPVVLDALAETKA